MGLDFSKTQTAPTAAMTEASVAQNEIEVVQEYDIVADR